MPTWDHLWDRADSSISEWPSSVTKNSDAHVFLQSISVTVSVLFRSTEAMTELQVNMVGGR
jgi:hypothetical protein